MGDLLPHAERMEQEVLAASRRVAGADARSVGTVRLATTETLATRYIAPHLARFRELHPDLLIELVCVARRVDLGRREADVVLRLTRPVEPDVMVRKLVQIDLGLYASRPTSRPRVPAPPDQSLSVHAVRFADPPSFAVEKRRSTAGPTVFTVRAPTA